MARVGVIRKDRGRPIFVFPLDLVNRHFLLPTMRIHNLLPFFEIKVGVQMVLLGPFVGPFDFRVLRVFLRTARVTIASCDILVGGGSHLLCMFDNQRPILRPTSRDLYTRSTNGNYGSKRRIL